MRWDCLLVCLLVASVVGKKKHRHHKPGRAVLDRLSSTTVGEVIATSGADSDDLLPAPLDVAPYSAVEANATCGRDGAEEYCRDTPGKRVVVCDVCEGDEGSSSRRHPPSHAVDGDSNTWWQSPTLAAGEFQHVEYVATLPDKMELLHVIIKSGPSPRPLAWSLEVSSSELGDDWRLVRAFGDKEHCKRLWDLRPERRRRKARRAARVSRTNRADKATCSTQFASPKPLENGEMHVGMGEGVSARRVRVSFRATHAAPALQQYYTIRALTLAARCLCHGHARECRVTAEGAKCSCLHNTCGSYCQRCCYGGAWGPHQPCAADPEDPCECGGRGACAYDDTGAILCVNCTENRAGPLCDRCLVGYYSDVPDGPCRPCDCDPDGSEGSCTWDEHHRRISCSCRPGYTGFLCDACADPTGAFPSCRTEPEPELVVPELEPVAPETVPECRCDVRGIVDPARACDDVCECKAHVVGERCDACAPGYFGLSGALAGGCRRCYCSHVTDSCAAAAEGPADPADLADGDREYIPVEMIIPLSEGWQVTDADRNETYDPSLDDQGRLYLVSYEVEGWSSFYWMTRALSGEQLSLYGSEIAASVFWGVVRGDTGGSPTVGPDVILIAADGTILKYGNRSYTPGSMELVAPLVEGGWTEAGGGAGEGAEGTEGGGVASRTRLLDTLSELSAVLVRAHFHTDQDEVRLELVELRAGGGGVPRERCLCPAGYTGAHCSRCAWTHARAPLAVAGAGASPRTPRFQCLACDCNSHAGCHTVDGSCGPCQHNTTGPHCERCLPGHYGNPVQGSCLPCACPLFLPSNNFSPNCALASAEGDEYVCTQCPDGYTGDHCENCDYGYWGAPRTAGSRCRPCECGGAPCDPLTGLCRTCPPHTEGARCDQCQEGYWWGGGGGGGGGGCVACACGAGALSAACDARGGQCACRPGWAGARCDRCDTGHGGVSAGCPPCRCGLGAVGGACDAVGGACGCAPGAAPPACDACLPDHYGLSAAGCHGCNCSSLGAESNACDIRTGQCRCKPHVTGRACDTCEEGYWGLQSGGCRRCACGAGAAACDPVSGACACASGVGGSHCDACLPGYYGFGPAGCLPCPNCTDGKVCSPESGRCVCPAHSHGPRCGQCATGYTLRGGRCEPCRCGAGAVSNTCDPKSGQCRCRSGWSGQECDACAQGYYGPRCRPCDCAAAGTRDCGNETCPCDERGRCPCKENVVGDKCDSCLEGTFGLSADNPTGCTACFCFGRTAQCTQASVSRAALHAASPVHLTLLAGEAVTSMDQESLLSIHTHSPDVTISLPWPPVPVYVDLDKRFLGDRVTSYGGVLRFRVEEEGGNELPVEVKAKFPLVRLYGTHVVLDYYERVPPINGTYSVRLHESLWAVRGRAGGAGAGARAARGALMLALQALQRVAVRVTTRAPTYQDHVHALLLNVSLDTAIPGLSRSEPALGVEVCECPRGYAASSCQDPAIGFWMPPQKVHLGTVAGTIVISLEGDAQECRCNGRATACDPHTGDCLNCTGGTGGPRCAVCAEGYHGAPDAAGGCQACPCPSRTRNFATACVFNGHHLQCLCKPGYTGRECESCAPGYVRGLTGACVPCACDVRGAASPHCDRAGRCRCRPHVTGDKCDQCIARRTYLDHDGCMACDNCTQTLLDALDSASSALRRAAAAPRARPPPPAPALLQLAHNTTTLQHRLHNLKNSNSTNILPLLDELEAKEHEIFTDAHRIKTESIESDKQASWLSLQTTSSLDEILKQKRLLGEQVGVLDEFARGERHLNAHRALKQATHLLRQIKGIKLNDYITGANDVLDLAKLQSSRVQDYNYRLEDSSSRLRRVRAQLDAWHNRTEDLGGRAGGVWAAGDAAGERGARARGRLQHVRDIATRCRLVLEDIESLSARNLSDATHSSLLLTQQLARSLPALRAELESLALAAEEKEGILYDLTPKYREKYLVAVQEHVKMLGQKAREYKSLFAGSRAVASEGVRAARAWADVTDTVRTASDAATMAAGAAHMAVKMARGPAPMTHAAGVARAASADLRARGAAVLARAEELRTQLSHLQRGREQVAVVLRGLGWGERALGLPPRADVARPLAIANEQADRVFATTRALYEEASDVRRRVTYTLRRQLAELQRHGDTALGAAQEHVSQIRGNTVRGAEIAEALAGAAAARAREHQAASATLAPAMAALRDKIARARHAADSIAVSLSSAPGAGAGVGAGAGCARAYAAWGGGSAAVTKLALAVSFDTLRDGPLLYLMDDTREPENYIELSVDRRLVKVSWELGAGEGHVVHPELLQPADDGDHAAYRIQVERIWNTVHLTVERPGSAPVTATNSTPPSATELRPVQLWLGHPLRPAGLPGCVHALYSDDNSVGLWSFVKQPQEARCTGCTQRWYNSGRGGDTLVSFNGEGYAELRRSSHRPSDRRQFSLAFTFRTRDEDALLFMAVDAANNRSVSVCLRACRVVFRVEYAGSLLEITGADTHCHGRPARVQAIRVFAHNKLERGSLRVNGAETLGSPSPPVQSAAALPDLTDAPYWVGGAPPGRVAPALPLLGCLWGLTIDGDGYDLLATPTRHGVESGCGTRSFRSATLEGAGAIELPSPLFRRKGALGLSFRARAPRGLLLLRAPAAPGGPAQDNEVQDDDEDDEDDRHYLALVMIEGELELVAAAGKAESRLRTNGTRFDDGRMHTARVVRAHKQLELWVDGVRVCAGTLAGNAYPARGRGTYLGGVGGWGPAHVPAHVPTDGFTGTIGDFIVDSSLIGLESAVRSVGARLGRADRPPAAAPPAPPRALHAQPEDAAGCTKTSSFTVEAGAVKFGDAAGSHAVLKLPPKVKELTVALQFRTFAPDGVLLYAPGTKSKPKHYIALLLKEGKLSLVVRGRRRRQVALPQFVADGTWRSVSIRVSRQRLVLSSGGAAATAHAPPAARPPRLYVGGLPPTQAVTHLPPQVLSVGGFVGCVRRVSVCGRAEDLVRDARAHYRVAQCFPAVERAAYFAGDAYASWSSPGGADGAGDAGGGGLESLELRVQFRSAAPAGLLLAAGGTLLELAGGKLILTRQSPIGSPGGSEGRVETLGAGGRVLCDNAWHTVVARVSRASLALALDGGPEVRGVSDTLLEDEDVPVTVTPIYVGGMPEGSLDGGGGGGGGGGGEVRESFKGCVREVWAGGHQLHWSQVDSIHNVLLDSCPVE